MANFGRGLPTDIFVIGGGPAGLAAAIAARQGGLNATLADSRRPPVDKACGEGLLPETREALAKLGVSIPAEESHSFRGIRFVSGKTSVQADFPRGSGLGVRRTVLHRLMVERAQSLGVCLRWETPVTALHPSGVSMSATLTGKIVCSRWIVGADGCNSLVRRWAGLDRGSVKMRFAFRRHYRVAPWSEYMEVHWAKRCQLYITPVASNQVCIALASSDPRFRLDTALPFFPDIAKKLSAAECTSSERGAISATRALRRVHHDRVVLVGDASGGVDCITGEGLGLAFQQADVLARSLLEGGDLRTYQRAHEKIARRPTLMSHLLLALDSTPSFRERVMRAFSEDPELFSQMLAMHVGASSPLETLSGGFNLARRLLTRELIGQSRSSRSRRNASRPHEV